MDISVTAAQPGRRRYLTLLMIFITVVICYVDRANLAVASMHIQKEFGITKAEMGYVFSAFAWLYTLCQIPGGWFSRPYWVPADLFYRYLRLVSRDAIAGVCDGTIVAYRPARYYRDFRGTSLSGK